MADSEKRRFRDDRGAEWWVYETRPDRPRGGAVRQLVFYSPKRQRRRRLDWPEELDDPGELDDAQLRGMLPLAEELPEQPGLRLDVHGEELEADDDGPA